MPVGYHHFYYVDMKSALHSAGMQEHLAPLEALEASERELRKQADALYEQRKSASNKLLSEHYKTIKPHLRPCHQKRFDTSEKCVELEARGWIY